MIGIFFEKVTGTSVQMCFVTSAHYLKIFTNYVIPNFQHQNIQCDVPSWDTK